MDTGALCAHCPLLETCCCFRWCLFCKKQSVSSLKTKHRPSLSQLVTTRAAHLCVCLRTAQRALFNMSAGCVCVWVRQKRGKMSRACESASTCLSASFGGSLQKVPVRLSIVYSVRRSKWLRKATAVGRTAVKVGGLVSAAAAEGRCTLWRLSNS